MADHKMARIDVNKKRKEVNQGQKLTGEACVNLDLSLNRCHHDHSAAPLVSGWQLHLVRPAGRKGDHRSG